MNKLLTILIVVVAGVGVVGGLAFFFILNKPAQQPSQTQQGNTTTPPNTNTSVVNVGNGNTDTGNTTGGFSLKANDGTAIAAKDPTKDPQMVQYAYNKDYYYLGGVNASSSSEKSYVIEYIASTQYFNIVLTKEPLGAAREAAQRDLETHLGITEADLCRLNAMVSVPYSVNQELSSQDLGFNVCPGAVPF